MTMILASASPRRAELLTQLGLSFDVVASNIDEEAIRATNPPLLVRALAKAKADAVAGQFDSNTLLLAADTIVVHQGHILGKPEDEESAFEMLSSLSGDSHLVYTGVCLLQGDRRVSFSECSEVRFRTLSDAEMHRYIATREPMDKAGGYGIQGFGALLVEGITGDYFNVMGLPLCRLGQALLEFGVDVLQLATKP